MIDLIGEKVRVTGENELFEVVEVDENTDTIVVVNNHISKKLSLISFKYASLVLINKEKQEIMMEYIKNTVTEKPPIVRKVEPYLISGKRYGETAQKIYLDCCDKIGFDRRLAGCFAKQKPLYADNATKEGWPVWFLANSNFTGTRADRWRNKISVNFQYIEESWTYVDELKRDLSDLGERVVFAKIDGSYIFLGVYVLEKQDDQKSLRIFKKVGETYPM